MDCTKKQDYASRLRYGTSSVTEYEFFHLTPDNSEEFEDYVKFALATRDLIELFKRITRLSVIVNGS